MGNVNTTQRTPISGQNQVHPEDQQIHGMQSVPNLNLTSMSGR